MPFEVIPYIRSLCKIDGMYGDDINGTTWTVGIGAITALKRDGSALIPASLVNVLKIQTKSFQIHLWVLFVELEAVAFTYAESQPLRTFLAKFVSDDGRIRQALALRSRTRTITYQLTRGRLQIGFSSTRASRWCSTCLAYHRYSPRRVRSLKLSRIGA